MLRKDRLFTTRQEVLLYLNPWFSAMCATVLGRKAIKRTATVARTVVTPLHLNDSLCLEATFLAKIKRRIDVIKSVMYASMMRIEDPISQYGLCHVGRLGEE
jgi:hypothetical protein